MDTTLVIILVIAGFASLIWFLNKKLSEIKDNSKPSEEILEMVKLIQDSSKEDRKMMLENLRDNSKILNERLDNAAKVIGAVQKNIGEMSEIGRSMRDLQEFLQAQNFGVTSGNKF